jgi:hypothetical protein
MGPSVPCPQVREITIPLTTSLPSGWVFTRASSATYWQNGTLYTAGSNVARFESDASGNLLGCLDEAAVTNIYLNSQSPATQTITVTAQAYTLSFYGTGTIALTGVYTGTLAGTGANNLVQLTFTPTAGSLIATPSGSVTNVQVEAGVFATSRIITAGASAARSTDNLSVPLSLYPWLQTAMGYSFAYRFSMLSGVDSTNLFLFSGPGGAGVNGHYGYTNSSNGFHMAAYISSSGTSSSSYGLGSAGTAQVVAGSISATGMLFSLNRAAPVSVSKTGLSSIPISTIQGSNGYGAFHLLSLTLRAGPSSAAWLQGGNY